MKSEDRGWDTLLERLELEMSDADLAAAEDQLRELPDGDVVDVRPEWIEATVAKATAPAEVVEEPVAEPVAEAAPLRRWGWWSKVQRFAAAALAFMSLHTAATAATVGVVAVTTVVIVWSGVFSVRNMVFQAALDLLAQEQLEGDRVSALTVVSQRVEGAVRALASVRNSNPQGSALFTESDLHVQRLLRIAGGMESASPLVVDDDVWKKSIATASSSLQSESDRLASMTVLADYSAVGLLGLRQMQANSPKLEATRSAFLNKLTALLSK